MTDDNDTEPTAPWPLDAAETWRRFDESPRGRELHQAAAEAVYLDGVGLPTNEGIEPILPTIRQELAEADHHGYDTLGALPYAPPFTDGMWPLPTVSINVKTEQFQARIAEASKQMGELGERIAEVFAKINDGLRPAFTRLGLALARATYRVPDGPVPPPVVDARTALIALNWAEWTEVVGPIDKPTRRHAKAQYLKVRRNLPHVYYRRLKSVPMKQFGSLT